jgi:hypothetical protein
MDGAKRVVPLKEGTKEGNCHHILGKSPIACPDVELSSKRARSNLAIPACEKSEISEKSLG